MKKIIDKTYDNGVLINKLNIRDNDKLKQAEYDIVTVRIHEVIKGGYYESSEEYLKELHKYLFSDVYSFAGIYRNRMIYKEEKILAGDSIKYSHPDEIEFRVRTLLEVIKETDYEGLSNNERVDYITHVLTNLWQIHPFREGNTRTSLLYMRQLLKSYGYSFNEYFFGKLSTFEYARNALVASCFEDEILGVEKNYSYIKRMVNDIVTNGINERKL